MSAPLATSRRVASRPDRADHRANVFTESYQCSAGTMRDIVTSFLPFWSDTRLWVLARPLSGFSETFSQYIVEVAPGGGSDRPELDPEAEGVLFVVGDTPKP